MMKDQYRRELEGLGPSQEELERLYEMIEGDTEMKQTKRFSGRAAAILVCAVLAITAAAAAAIPAVWEELWEQLGAFAPYAQTIDGAVCRDQGIEVQVLSALSDDLEARFYLSVRDVTGDHQLNEYLTLTGRLETGEKKEQEPKSQVYLYGSVSSSFELLSYDPETKTALFSSAVSYGEMYRPKQDARLAITGMSTQAGRLYGNIPCFSITGDILDSYPAGEQAEVIFNPSDLDDRTHLDALILRENAVLASEQNPVSFAETKDMWVSSMGFAGDNCFHIRLGLADGVRPETRGFFCDLFQLENMDERLYTYQQTLVEGGMDIIFPMLHPEDLELIRSCEARFYGPYTRPGTVIEGSWDIDFQLEYYPSSVLDWTGTLAGRQVRQVTVSPLSVTMHSDDPGGFHSAVLYAVKKDGSTVAAEPGTGRYSNEGTGGETVWGAFNTWEFEEPVDVADIAALTLEGETIPVN